MKRYDGVIICSDFDGTLYDGLTQEISAENAEAIRYFQEHGGRFTLATGRYPNILEKKADRVRGVRANAPVIAANGCLVYDLEKKETLYSVCLDEKFPRVLAEVIDSFDRFDQILFFRKNIWKSIEIPREERDELMRQGGLLPHKVYIKLTLPDDPVAELEESDRIKEEMLRLIDGRYEVMRASVAGLELLPLGVTKGSYVRKLADSLGCDKLICVGDYENDIAMIKAADIGYAMGNAHPSLFDVADRIAPSVEKSAIAKIIYEL